MRGAPQGFVLVQRDQLRVKGKATICLPPTRRAASRPTVPPTLDLSKNRAIVYPILDNSRYGDCYLAAALHQIQQWAALLGPAVTFELQTVVNYYLQLSGGDNGLSDDQIYPAWKAGIPFAPANSTLLDYALVDVTSDDCINECMFYCSGLLWTASLEDTWLSQTAPGTVWQAGGRPDPAAGHAMLLSGYRGLSDALQVETWAISPPICVTRAGMREAQPELIACASLANFGPDGRTVNGITYDDFKVWWTARTGRLLPPWPGPAPVPPPAPGPGSLCDLLESEWSLCESTLANHPFMLFVARLVFGWLAGELGCAAPSMQTAAGKKIGALGLFGMEKHRPPAGGDHGG
jgi:hypothetical protein